MEELKMVPDRSGIVVTLYIVLHIIHTCMHIAYRRAEKFGELLKKGVWWE